jgi:hypothetical protein
MKLILLAATICIASCSQPPNIIWIMADDMVSLVEYFRAISFHPLVLSP